LPLAGLDRDKDGIACEKATSPRLCELLRIEERELEAGGLN
jgi:hypothetical protein